MAPSLARHAETELDWRIFSRSHRQEDSAPADPQGGALGLTRQFFARSSPDGKEIVFLLQDSPEKKIYRMPLAGGEPVAVVDGRKPAGR